MSAAADKRGLKRVCVDCGNRFYDFNKRPVLCPVCQTEFTGIEKIKTKRGRSEILAEAEGQVSPKAAVANDDSLEDDEVEIEDDAVVISLDDLESAEAEGDDDIDPDLDLEEDGIEDLDIGLDDEGPESLEEIEEEAIRE